MVCVRREIKKFGDSANLPPGPDSKCTNIGDEVFLKLSFGQVVKAAQAEPAKKNEVSCRYCHQNHFSIHCPYKNDLGGETSVIKPATLGAAPVTNTYVPPSQRSREGGKPGDRNSDDPVIRITNLSTEATEADVRELVQPFGLVSRVFVARDRETNVCKGFSFVTFVSRSDAENAITKLNGYGYDNLILKAEWSKSD